MYELAHTIAQAFHAVLPAWVRLPSLTFELPHLIYWPGLIIFPLIAVYLIRREERSTSRDRVTAPVSYLLWLTGGFAGLHRFYLRAPTLAFGYIALFLLVLYGNKQGALARNVKSAAANDLKGAEFDIERYARLVARGREGAEARLEKARETLVSVKAKLADATAVLEQWEAFAGGFAALIAIFLIVDAFLIPRLRRRCLALEADAPPPAEYQVMARGPKADVRRDIHTPFTRAVDKLSGWAGHFVAYWSVLAVFVYYYEVVARYVFNSPTNWAHESMFLMFGMQYLICGAFALREDAHVRVDVIYEQFSEKTKAWMDIVTSIFFFVFTIALLVTGIIFALDSISVWEVSFTEWAIQYWPVKVTIAVGAFLIALQGVAKLTKDIAYLRGVRA